MFKTITIILNIFLIGCSIAVPAGYTTERTGQRYYITDSVGNIQYHKGGYQVVGNKIYQINSIGNIQYHKPALKAK